MPDLQPWRGAIISWAAAGFAPGDSLEIFHVSTTRAEPFEIVLNGRAVVSNAATVAALLAEQGFGGLKVATAVNGGFVAERARDATHLKAGDSVEVVSARQGG
jgi:sulfur carrier protein